MSEITAVACVIETSLALAAEWPHVLADYLAPLLQRLGETHTSSSLRMGFVSYGTADTRPTPIVSRVFFIPPQMMTKTMREQPQELGIGRTGSGGGQGMAALEGVVAAIEMFETLKSSIEKANATLTSHLIHIASTSPDTAERPMWNVSPSLDDVTWATMPAELRRRGIHYSNILMKRLTGFSDLQASAAVGTTQTPWFNVRSPHAVLITGFPQKGMKRSGNAATASERSPDMKRARVQPASPLKSPAVIAAAPPPSRAPAPLAAPPSSTLVPVLADNGSGPSFGPLDPARRAIFHEKLRQAEMTLRVQMNQIVQLEKEGRMDTAKQLRLIAQQRAEKLNQIKSALLSQAQQAQGSGTGQSTAGPSVQPPAAPSAVAQPSDPPEAPAAMDVAVNPNSGGVSTPPSIQSAPTATAKPMAYTGMPPNTPPHVPPDMAAQMMKLVEQKNRLPQQQTQQSVASTSSARHIGDNSLRDPWTWNGTFSWSEFDAETHLSKDVQTRVLVKISGTNPFTTKISEIWPDVLSLNFSQDPAVPYHELEKYLAPRKMLFTCFDYIQLDTQVPDLEANKEHFCSLICLLADRNVYAFAECAAPFFAAENRILIIQHNGVLKGMYFPGFGGVVMLPIGGTSDSMTAQKIPCLFAKVTWNGMFFWSRFNAETHLWQDVHTWVLVQGLQSSIFGYMKPDTWPDTLTLTFTKAHNNTLHSFIACYGPHYIQLRIIEPDPQVPDTKANEEQFCSLICLLTDRNVYALAAWADSNGAVYNRILIVLNDGKLMGVYFPHPRGMPEMLRGDFSAPAPAPAPVVQTPIWNKPPGFMSPMQHRTPEPQGIHPQQTQQQLQMHSAQLHVVSTSPHLHHQPQQQNAPMNASMHATAPNVNQLANPVTAQNQMQGQQLDMIQNLNPDMATMSMGSMEGMNLSSMVNMANMPDTGLDFGMTVQMQQQQQGGMEPVVPGFMHWGVL